MKSKVFGILSVMLFFCMINIYAERIEVITVTNYELSTNQIIIISATQTNFSTQIVSNMIISMVTNVLLPQPPLNNLRVTGELMTGIIGGGLSWAAYAYILMNQTNFSDQMSIASGFIIASVPSILLSALGTYLIGNIGNETGKFIKGSLTGSLGGFLIGTIAGGACSLVIFNINSLSRSEQNLYAGITMISAMSISESVCSTIWFNNTRSYKKGTVLPGALINLYDNDYCFSLPSLKLEPVCIDKQYSLSYNFDLLQYSF